MTSPSMRVTGRGDIDVVQGTLDYTMKAVVTAAAPTLAGKRLARLGVPVPLHVTGLLSSPKYAVSLSGGDSGAAK